MREIKFRAWDKEKEKMLTGMNQYGADEPDFNKAHSSAGAFTRLWEALARFAESDRFILMQYTGLKDKNGKELYEGDVVKWNAVNTNFISTIEWWKGRDRWIIRNNKYDIGALMVAHKKCEIIGNIYQDKHLLDK